MIKNLVKALVPKYILELSQRGKKQIKNFRSLATGYGQWATIRDWNAIDGKGMPIPWYSYPATEYLSHLKLDKYSVFEFGSGNSTLWWASRAKRVVSVEDDEVWFNKVRSSLSTDNLEYLLKGTKEEYVSAANLHFDIFVIDGKWRRECAEQVVKIGGRGVMIVLDNSDWYPCTVDYLKESLGWVQVDFHGFGPINNYTWTTTVFLNPLRHSDLSYDRPLGSKCGLVQISEGDYYHYR